MFFFQSSILKSLIRNPIVLFPDDINTLCSAGDTLEETRNIIDRNIARLEENIRALKSRRNELSSISRLPAEILCNIFKFSLSEKQTRTPDWTNFSQVSQHWRTSALGAPELWTIIPLRYPRWAEEMLTRSKMAKLTIRSSPSLVKLDLKTIETVRSCLYEMNRIEKIKFTEIPGRILEEFFRDLPKSAPQLHTLCIRPLSSTFSIHEDFLYDTERLKIVELFNCRISWDSRLLTGLTRLTLENSLEANSSIIQLLQALQRMPALTNLRLKDSIPDDSEGPFTYAVVDLPCLQVLSISSGVSALTAVLRHITFPHSAVLNLTCKENQSTHNIDFSNFLSVLATKFLSTLVIRSLDLGVFTSFETHHLKLSLWTTALIDFPLHQLSQTQLQLVLSWPTSRLHNHKKVLTCAFDAMSLSFLTQLQISTSDYIDSPTWVKTFGKLPQLERVCVQSSLSFHSLLEALVYKTKAAEKSKTAYCNVSFPKLRYLHLDGADFFVTSRSTISVYTLLDCLMERYERNAEVRVLRLDDCNYITFNEVEKLKEVVVDVIWDGQEEQEWEVCSV